MRRYLSYLPSNWEGQPPAAEPVGPGPGDLRAMVPASERQAYDMRRYVKALLDEGSFFEIHPLWAREVVVGLGRLDGQVVGVVANNPMIKGGVLFVDSADKAARFIQLCDAFNVPLLFLADVPGFMVGTAVERQGIIRHGAKLISAVAEATVPKISVIVRKAYGAGLYAMCRAGLLAGRDAGAADGQDRRHGRRGRRQRGLLQPDPGDRGRGRTRGVRPAKLREEYDEDIDIVQLASELVVDAIVEPEDLRGELIRGSRRTGARTARSPAAATASRRSEVHPLSMIIARGCAGRLDQGLAGGVIRSGRLRLEEHPAPERPEPPHRAERGPDDVAEML